MPPFLENFIQNKPLLQFPVRFTWRLVERWNADNCPLMAAAMAFFGLLSVFPLTLAGVALLARFLAGNAVALKDFALFVAGFFPGAAGLGIATEIEKAVRAIASGPSATTLGIVAVGSLLWSGRAYFDTLATVLNRIFPGATPRSFLSHQLTLWGLILGVGVLFLLSTGTTVALSLAQSVADRFPHLFINRAPWLFDFLGKLAGYVITLFMFYVLYRYTPNRTVPPKRRVVLGAAFIAAVGWEVAKWGFARFLGNVTRYEATYGSVAGVVVTMLWIYFASMIILAGAEVGATYEEHRMKKAAAEKEPTLELEVEKEPS